MSYRAFPCDDMAATLGFQTMTFSLLGSELIFNQTFQYDHGENTYHYTYYTAAYTKQTMELYQLTIYCLFSVYFRDFLSYVTVSNFHLQQFTISTDELSTSSEGQGMPLVSSIKFFS